MARQRLLALLLISLPVAAATPNLSDIDVQGIVNTSAEFVHGPLTFISEASSACTLTAESGCTLEVEVVAGGDGPVYRTVSKVNGVWIIGRWQREIIAFERCVVAVHRSERRDAAAGIPVDHDKYWKSHRACYPQSGQFWAPLRPKPILN